MRLKTLAGLTLFVAGVMLAIPAPADAQLRRLAETARRAAESEAESVVDQLIRNAIRCAIDDPICVESAEAEGEDVIFVDGNGEVIVDEEGAPITDRDAAAAASGAGDAPGEGLWANYDFVTGDRIIWYEDFTSERVGNFPRRIEFIEGNWEVVEAGSKRYLRGTSAGIVRIPLPEELPNRFTVEFEVNTTHGNSSFYMMTGPAIHGRDRSYTGSAAVVRSTQAGIQPIGDVGPTSMTLYEEEFLREFRNNSTPKPFRFMIDGDYVKIYLNEHRVANVPNAVFPRSDGLYFAISSVSPETPALIGPIKIAAGGADLYGRLTADGRVATQGILFAVDSDRLRPESTPTLDEIGRMLQDHPDLRIAIEGHTDSDGDDAHNMDLSQRRADSVKRYLVDEYGIDDGRLETAGFGETMPAADNMTPEGKQQNRRVELVRLG
ncbi:MAG: OmpA family protein [Gemmatimonadota bacterium]|nr:OmpA family protein [Gemmatimonadota bacterium]